MLTRVLRNALYLLACTVCLAQAADDGGFAPGGSEQCLGCHDFGPESPVHAVLDGSHGQADDMSARRGCEDCHGPSATHAQSPTRVSPGVSFGPRWSSTIAAQDTSCLSCHEEETAAHWEDALHMLNDLTCVTCHDIHTGRDKVLFSEHQAEVCTICHKAQKAGIHGLDEDPDADPACTTCHNPHDHESPVTEMLGNRSEGCRSCHDLVEMAALEDGSDKARSYHKVMAQADRTCLDCHQGISHAAPGSVPPMVPTATHEGSITLFYPGQSDSEWLRTEHTGAQPLRQGTGCQQCHRGEEAAMGEALAEGKRVATRQLDVAFSIADGALQIDLGWRGPADDADIALMWGDRGNRVFQRGGCFAACHNDMPGMTRDRGVQTGKYLLASRVQEQRVGQPALVRDADELAKLRAENYFIEMWRIDLASGRVETSALLEKLDWSDARGITTSASHDGERWTVRIRRPLGQLPGLKNFHADERYTFGVALHGADQPGGNHWISLPVSLGLASENTDFRAE